LLKNVIQSTSKVINFQIKNIEFVITNIYNQLFVKMHNCFYNHFNLLPTY